MGLCSFFGTTAYNSAPWWPAINEGQQRHQNDEWPTPVVPLHLHKVPTGAGHLSALAPPRPFVTSPGGVFFPLLTSSRVFRRSGRPLIEAGTKQEKFRHLSEELKSSDNVLGQAQIRRLLWESDKSGGRLLHPSCLKLRSGTIKWLEVMAAVSSGHPFPRTANPVLVCD